MTGCFIILMRIWESHQEWDLDSALEEWAISYEVSFFQCPPVRIKDGQDNVPNWSNSTFVTNYSQPHSHLVFNSNTKLGVLKGSMFDIRRPNSGLSCVPKLKIRTCKMLCFIGSGQQPSMYIQLGLVVVSPDNITYPHFWLMIPCYAPHILLEMSPYPKLLAIFPRFVTDLEVSWNRGTPSCHPL